MEFGDVCVVVKYLFSYMFLVCLTRLCFFFLLFAFSARKDEELSELKQYVRRGIEIEIEDALEEISEGFLWNIHEFYISLWRLYE